MLYSVKKVRIYNIKLLLYISKIIKKCGDDMYNKYQLKHWKNSFFKTFLIVIYTSLKNSTYCVFDKKNIAIATYQVKILSDTLHFSKLAVLPTISGNGIGSFCLNEIESFAKKKELHYLECEVYVMNHHAYSFYLNRGFKECNKIETFRYKEVVLKKRI